MTRLELRQESLKPIRRNKREQLARYQNYLKRAFFNQVANPACHLPRKTILKILGLFLIKNLITTKHPDQDGQISDSKPRRKITCRFWVWVINPCHSQFFGCI